MIEVDTTIGLSIVGGAIITTFGVGAWTSRIAGRVDFLERQVTRDRIELEAKLAKDRLDLDAEIAEQNRALQLSAEKTAGALHGVTTLINLMSEKMHELHIKLLQEFVQHKDLGAVESRTLDAIRGLERKIDNLASLAKD